MKKTALLVILVEDQESLGKNMKKVIENHGFQVIWCRDSGSAQETYDTQKEKLFAVILDGHLNDTSKDDTLPLIKHMVEDNFQGFMIATSLDPTMEFQMKVAGCTSHCTKMDIIKELQKLTEMSVRTTV